MKYNFFIYFILFFKLFILTDCKLIYWTTKCNRPPMTVVSLPMSYATRLSCGGPASAGGHLVKKKENMVETPQ